MGVKRIHIIGGPGSGKTYLAGRLSEQLHIPPYELDDLFWDNHAGTFGIKAEPDQRNERLKAVIHRDAWIIEGVYYAWVLESLERADSIVILRTHVFIRDFRIIKRFIQRKFGFLPIKKRETVSGLIKLIKWNHHFEHRSISDILQVTEVYAHKRLVLQRKRDIREFIQRIQSN